MTEPVPSLKQRAVIEEGRLKNAERREHIVGELVDTERAYVNVLTEIERVSLLRQRDLDLADLL